MKAVELAASHEGFVGLTQLQPSVETDAGVAVIYWDSGRKVEWKDF